jgi:integrase/recombinase XerD
MSTQLSFFFTDSTAMRTFRALTEAPLGSAIEIYARYMRDQGYARQSAREYLRLLGRFNLWLADQGCTPEMIQPDTVRRFREYLQHRGKLRNGFGSILRHLLQMIRPDLCVCTPSPLELVLRGFREYQIGERGLVHTTAYSFGRLVRNFLEKQVPGGGSGDLSKIEPDLIADWIRTQASCTSAAHAKHIVSALRSFLSYAFYRGLIERNLATCVPGAPGWSLVGLPRHLSPEQVQKVLDSCDRNRPAGRRDFAILLLLARLGLRAGEIATIKLDDLDWDTGTITVHGKSRRSARLPLPQEIGEAIADYLCNERPKCKSRQVFITARPPHRPFHDVVTISMVATRALKNADMTGTRTGSHVFRHSLATTMLKNGASLGEIGDILRHRNSATTQIYAKVDVSALRELALPWPGVSR